MTRTLLLVGIFVVTLLAITYATAGAGRTRLVRRRLGGLRRAAPTARDIEQEELARPFSERVLRPALASAGESLSRLLPSRAAASGATRLSEAGAKITYAQFVAIKFLALAAVALFSLTVLLPLLPGGKRPLMAFIAAMFALLAFRVPDFWLSRAIEDRHRALQRQLPDVMDLLCISVEAGLGFDGAIQKVAEKFRDPVATEFSTYLAETRIGRPRAEALRNLARRAGIPDMRAFTAAVIQADQLGVSLTKVLRAQSESMRVKRKQRVQERAMQIPVKMLIPMAIFIFPTVFIVLLGPAVITIIQTLARP
ncbi:MAG: type II secretion system F family protein [Chloroflexota bacterium]